MNAYQEFLYCQESFEYFVNNYIKIICKKKGSIPFKLHPFQNKFINLCESEKILSVIKFRQGGFTTIAVYYALWKCMFQPDQRFLFVARTDREAKHIAKIIDWVFEFFPDWLVPQLTVNKANHKKFLLTKSSIMFHSAETCRGLNPNYIVFDEAAFIPNAERCWTELWPTIANDGKALIMSTTNGVNNWFYDICCNKLITLYKPSYKEHPYYNDENFLAELKNLLTERVWQQEILGNFVQEEIPYDKQINYDLATELQKFTYKEQRAPADYALLKAIIQRLKEI